MPDARGHGLSDQPASGYSNQDHARDIAGLIQALNLDNPAVGGHSMGAATTLRLVADYPDLASCAILEDPPIWSASPRPLLADPARANPCAAPSSTLIRRTSSHHRSRQERAPIVVGRRMATVGRRQEARQHPLPGRDGHRPTREKLARDPHSVKVPMLLITSDPERGGIVTPEASAEAQQILPSLQVIRLEGAGHNIRREQFDPFLAAVQTFLAAHARATTHATT